VEPKFGSQRGWGRTTIDGATSILVAARGDLVADSSGGSIIMLLINLLA